MTDRPPTRLTLAERVRALRERLWWLVVRGLQRLLAGSRGEVTALEQALRLQERLVVLAMVVVSVVPALLLLAYFAFTTSDDSVSFETEARQQAEREADELYREVSSRFESFETEVERRIRSGPSPLLRPEQLHPQLRVALQFDRNGVLMAPFVEPAPADPEDAVVLFSGPYAWLRDLAAAGASSEDLLDASEQVSRNAPSRVARGMARLEEARVLEKLGRRPEALDVLEALADQGGETRNPWGFRLSDMARLEAARLRRLDQPEASAEDVRKLVEDLLAETWVVGRGGEAAIARRALQLVSTTQPPAWVADASARVVERARLLYWAERLLPEARKVLGYPDAGRLLVEDIRWSLGDRNLWALRASRGTLYAFALDWDSIRQELNDRTRGFLSRDGPVSAWFRAPDEIEDDLPGMALATRDLPWVPGGALIIKKGPLFEREAQRRANQIWLRNAAVIFSLLTLVLGVLFTIRIVNREMDLAQMKTRFAANVSHELRSPLTQIRLKGEALMLGLADTPEEQQEYYRAIVRESERLGRLVDDVLDYALLPSGRHNLAPRIRLGSLEDTVQRALDSIRSSEEVRRMDLDVDVPGDLPLVAHDPDAVVRCVINLVSNAAKYSKDSNWIGVRARHVDGALEVSISDRGIGIHPNDLDRIFDPYVRGTDPRVGTKKGAGLGLTMTQEIMKAHGGKVLVQSRLGKGSTFTLRFPLRTSSPAARTTDPPSRPSRQPGA